MPPRYNQARRFPFEELTRPDVMIYAKLDGVHPENMARRIREEHQRVKKSGALPPDHEITCVTLEGGAVGVWRKFKDAATKKSDVPVPDKGMIQPDTFISNSFHASEKKQHPEPEDDDHELIQPHKGAVPPPKPGEAPDRVNMGGIIRAWCHRAKKRSDGVAKDIGVDKDQMRQYVVYGAPVPESVIRKIMEQVGARTISEFMSIDA